jgi:hypothetical protein
MKYEQMDMKTQTMAPIINMGPHDSSGLLFLEMRYKGYIGIRHRTRETGISNLLPSRGRTATGWNASQSMRRRIVAAKTNSIIRRFL